MSLKSASILTGATASFSGGTPTAYTLIGRKVNNGICCANTAVADFRVRPFLIARYWDPVLTKGGIWLKGKANLQFVFPKILTDGSQEYPYVEITCGIHPENTPAEVDNMLLASAQGCVDADFSNLWKYGSLE